VVAGNSLSAGADNSRHRSRGGGGDDVDAPSHPSRLYPHKRRMNTRLRRPLSELKKAFFSWRFSLIIWVVELTKNKLG
jgi:hypothetical protein